MESLISLNVKVLPSVRINSEEKEIIGVVGNTKEIGSWLLKDALILKPNKTDRQVWEATFSAPAESTVFYRYFIGSFCQNKIAVSSWEAGLKSRCITISKNNGDNIFNDTFGKKDCENGMLLDEGWLTQEHEFRFSISSPSNFPVLQFVDEEVNRSLKNQTSLQLQLESSKASLSSTLVTITPYQSAEIKGKKSYTIPLPTNSEVHYMFNVKTFEPFKEYVCFHVIDKNGRKLGSAIVSCSCLPKSKGIVKVPLVNNQCSVTAVIRVPYVHIKPFSSSLSMEHCFTRYWKPGPMLHVGHRGCGNSFTSEKLANVWENTLASFHQASKHRADFVEFDVHLTKDGIPIIYHDLTTCVAAAARKTASPTLLHLPVHTLHLDELQSLHVRHKSRKTTTRNLEFNESTSDYCTLPFPTLKEALSDVPLLTGFNIEVKWPTLDEEHKFEDEMEHYFDANFFVDSILKVVFEGANSRKVIFSCFDVDICIMLRRKQNKYPVLFLTNGDTKHYTPLLDLREATNAMAIGTAKAEGFLGLDTLEKDVYQNPDIVKKTHEAGLIFACYGDYVGENLDKMEQAKVDIAIYDRIYEKIRHAPLNGS